MAWIPALLIGVGLVAWVSAAEVGRMVADAEEVRESAVSVGWWGL